MQPSELSFIETTREISMAKNPLTRDERDDEKDMATNRDRLPDHIEQVEQSDDVGPGAGGDMGGTQSGLDSDAGSGTACSGRDNSRTGRGPLADPARPK